METKTSLIEHHSLCMNHHLAAIPGYAERAQWDWVGHAYGCAHENVMAGGMLSLRGVTETPATEG